MSFEEPGGPAPIGSPLPARALAVALLALTSCPRSGAPPLEVSFTGCEEVLAGPRCALAPGEPLRMWVHAERPPEVEGARPPATWRRHEGGWALTLTPGPEPLSLRAGSARWKLDFVPSPKPDWQPAVERALAHGRLNEAEALLDAVDEDAPDALRQSARLAWRRGRSDVAALQRAAASAFEAEGRSSAAVDALLAAGHAHLGIQRDLGATADRIAEASRLAGPDYARGRLLAAELVAQLALAAGDRRGALDVLQTMQEEARRLAEPNMAWTALLLTAQTLQHLGQLEAADQSLVELAAMPAPSPCHSAMLDNTRAWSGLLRAERSGRPQQAPIEARLARASEVFEGVCPQPLSAAEVRLNRALLALLQGAPGRAAEQLDAMPGALGPEQAGWQRLLRARVALAEGRAEVALEGLDALLERPDMSELLRWRARTRRASALLALGREQEALESYREAEADTKQSSLALPIQQDRAAFLASRARVHREHLGLLARRGDAAAFVARARAERRWLLEQLDFEARVRHLEGRARRQWLDALGAVRQAQAELARARASAWGLARDQLPAALRREAELADRVDAAWNEAARVGGIGPTEPGAGPEPGELILGFAQSSDGWYAYHLAHEQLGLHRIGTLDPEAPPARLAERLLTPVAPVLRAARSVRLLLPDALEDLDVHALPLDGAPLGLGREVVYALDLPPHPPGSASDGALVVSDPEGDLQGARHEGVAALLARRGYATRALRQAEVTHLAVRSLLPRVARFHYSGHADHHPLGWRSGLRLAGGERLESHDILALPSAPETVVLAGCETGSGAAGLGVAQAFLLAGSRWVLSTTRPVADEASAAVVRALYEAEDPPSATFSEALRSVVRAHPDVDWAAFRVWVR